jgi:hypothetical protein
MMYRLAQPNEDANALKVGASSSSFVTLLFKFSVWIDIIIAAAAPVLQLAPAPDPLAAPPPPPPTADPETDPPTAPPAVDAATLDATALAVVVAIDAATLAATLVATLVATAMVAEAATTTLTVDPTASACLVVMAGTEAGAECVVFDATPFRRLLGKGVGGRGTWVRYATPMGIRFYKKMHKQSYCGTGTMRVQKRTKRQ